MAQESALEFEVQEVYLDAYIMGVNKTLVLPPSFAALYQDREPLDDDFQGLGPPEQPPEKVAILPDEVVDFVIQNSRDRENLTRARTNFTLHEAGFQELFGLGWPWGVTHFWFRIKVIDRDARATQSYVYGWLQNFYYALRDVISSSGSKDDGLHSSAVLSILANCHSDFFSTIKQTWETATQQGSAPSSSNAGDLWTKLPQALQFGNAWSMNHMAMAAHLHASLTDLYSSPERERQLISITFQDESRPSYTREGQGMAPDRGGFFTDEVPLLAPNRGAYYRPRSQELGILLLLDQWLQHEAKAINAAALIVNGAVSESQARKLSDHLLGKNFNFPTLQGLRTQTGAISRRLRDAAAISRPPLRSLVGGQSIFAGVEVPAHLYPQAQFGRQGTQQEGLILAISERVLLRMEENIENTKALEAIIATEIDHQFTRGQLQLARLMAILAVTTLILTIVNVVVAIP